MQWAHRPTLPPTIGQWHRPALFSLGVHLVLTGFLVATPHLGWHTPREEIHTVELFTAAEVEPPPPAPPPAPPKTMPATPAVPPVSLAPAATEPPAAAPRKVISLTPLKSKKRVTKPEAERKAEETRRELEVQRLRARLARERAAAAAAAAKQQALETIRQAIHATAPTVAPVTTPAATGTAATGKTAGRTSSGATSGDRLIPAVRRNYYAAVLAHLSRYWVLPQGVDWSDSLEAVVVLRIRRDGTIVGKEFERESENVYFNRFVKQTLERAGTLPPLPEQLPEQILELGIRFRPGEIGG